MKTPVREGQTAPILGGITTVTASDSTEYDPPLRGLYVGVTGDVAIVLSDGSSGTYKNLVSGVIHPITNIKKIMATGTTALNILAHIG